MIFMNPPAHGAPEMDHRYIDQHALAERYLENALPVEERAVFEAHMVDCQECRDRLLLAGMFHARQTNGIPARPAAKLTVRLKRWQLAALLITGGLLLAALLAIPAFVLPVFLRSR
jgi:hypothetical protein